MFEATELVELRQICFTPGRVFEPGKYITGDLPDVAFTMGLVEKLPPVRGKSEEVADLEDVTDTTHDISENVADTTHE
ncbi:8-amino-7-oxononanoate synthase [Leptolyngbya sp. Heron Island J]|nr:8-amino-7-oxononanoate synthase [Leptolyngbya sp. Heron Island J]